MTKDGSKIVNDIELELTPQETELLDDPADESGRVSPARAARLLGQVVFRTEELRWTPELVKLRLREAIIGVEKLLGRVGPSEKTGFWPQHVVEFSDRVGLTEKQLREIAAGRNRYAVGFNEGEVTRIEEAIRWPWRYLGAESLKDQRAALQLWLWCEAKNLPWERFCAGLGCAKRTAYYRRDRATQIIFEGLVKDGVLP